MYTDPEEARSDLLLAGAVYLFGPILLGLLGFLTAVPVLGPVLVIAQPLLTTVVVPILMIRYRKERWADYGLAGARGPGIQLGLLLAAPMVVAVVVAALVQGGRPPEATLPALVFGGSWVDAAANLARWIGLTGLALYVTVKARDAFRSELYGVRTGILEVGRVLGIVGAIAALLLVVSTRLQLPLSLLLVPLGAAAAVALLYRSIRGPGSTTRMTLVAPTVLLALAPFNPFALFSNAQGFVASTYIAVYVGAIGLLVAGSLEGRRTGWAAVGLGVTLGLLVPSFF